MPLRSRRRASADVQVTYRLSVENRVINDGRVAPNPCRRLLHVIFASAISKVNEKNAKEREH